jgi:type VI secretion system secreted protein Hcp
MAVDVFLKLGDIKGESTDAKHAGEIDVLSWSWGISQTGSAAPGGGGGAGKVSFNDLTFTHNVDKASPMLMKACATGQHVKEATLVARKAGKGQQEYLVIKMTDVLVTGVQPSSAHEQPMENVSMQFAKIDVEYKPLKADGTLDAGIHFVYDIKANKVG